MDRITHQSPRQRGYGSTSSLRNDSVKHTRKHEKGREESNQEAKLTGSGRPSGQEGWTIRQGTTDCPHPFRGLSGLSRGPSVKANKTSSGTPRTTDRPRGARGLSARHPRTVRPTHADRPPNTRGPSETSSNQNSKPRRIETKGEQELEEHRTNTCGADRPRGTDRAEMRPTSKVNSPKSSSDFPNGRSCGDKGLGT
jgi:hypothetical protein